MSRRSQRKRRESPRLETAVRETVWPNYIIAGGLALRSLARTVVPRLPVGRRFVRAAIAAGGTLALGEAAARRPSL